MKRIGLPKSQGLYHNDNEKDNCGIGFISHIKGEKSHEIVEKGMEILINLTHRGATGCDAYTGDGAGILVQIPHEFFKIECEKQGINLPEAGDYAAGMLFLPRESDELLECEGIFEKIVMEEGLTFIGWRSVPVDHNSIGEIAAGTEPLIKQVFIERGNLSEEAFETKLYIIRKRVENAVRQSDMHNKAYFYVTSLSSQTIVYKGLLLAEQVGYFYKDLKNEHFKSAIALVHQRYSTNTFPTWDLAQPFRYIAHNGEINTIKGNRNWMRAREGVLKSDVFGDNIDKLFPILSPNASDSASFDQALELLIRSGRSLIHAMMMLIPEAWQNSNQMSEEKKAFYNYHAMMMEPWDGPAAMAFTNGKQIAATLDRNGLRPSRYTVTKDDLVILASETGVLEIDPANVAYKGRLEPGKMFLVDLEKGCIIQDEVLKEELAKAYDYVGFIEANQVTLKDLESPSYLPTANKETLFERQQTFGYTHEELKMVLAPMAQLGKEATGSMGNDTPFAVLSDKPQLLYSYFKQLFAQVTNPAIDPIREALVMSLKAFMGGKPSLLEGWSEDDTDKKFLKLEHPILSNEDLGKISKLSKGELRSIHIPMLFKAPGTGEHLKEGLEVLCERAKQAIEEGYTIIILSDRDMGRYEVPIPALLATSALQQYLLKNKLRTKVNIVVETGEAREIMHMALLIGYGATAINPYLAFESIDQLVEEALYVEGLESYKAHDNYIKAINLGLLKIISKMGISTIQSYRSAQIFEAIGLGKALIDDYFTGTSSRIGGIDLGVIAKESMMRHQLAYGQKYSEDQELEQGGEYHYRPDGAYHHFNPYTISKLQQSTRTGNYETFKDFSEAVNNQSEALCTIRGLMKFKERKAIPVEVVEPASSIVKRFATGAMSFGSLSKEAHEVLAVAMNTIGARSNTGEGGEDTDRFLDNRRSSIKQIASGRFGVTTNYLVNADELQIKLAQGAKPGEGGQLPGKKVNEVIGKVRHATPGIDLISPPPHHDIYSIEDLAQLIHDLKNVNKEARISVKLVSEVGVGTVAAGVAKAKADVILVSGHDGGTGASPLTSIKYAGIPWELGVAETQQVLLLNDLRGKIILQTDGQLKTGRDVVIAALLGAEEYGFATAPLVVSGCMMMRKCHLNTCPVGVATQDPELRKKFTGKPEHLVKYFFFVAEEVRELMASLGFRTIDEMIGRTDVLEINEALKHWKTKEIDLSSVLYKPNLPQRIAVRNVAVQDHGIDKALDHQLIKVALPALEKKEAVKGAFEVRNINRTLGTMLSGEIAKRYGEEGLPEDTIWYNLKGSAGQSFGAFLASGLTLDLEGEGNDYVGKGMSGGKLIIKPPAESTFVAAENIIAGNTILYGATGGEVYINGRAGERFAVRNSGAVAVVEGIGDHGCEYMTGGRVVVLGKSGVNFAAGMSGGVAYVYDEDGTFSSKLNTEIVELEPLLATRDEEAVRALVEKHTGYTGSEKGKYLLENWEVESRKFYRVISSAYKEVLEKQEEMN